MNLVKKILVSSVLAENDPTQSYLKIEDILRDPFRVKIKFYKMGRTGPTLASVSLKKDDDLFQKSNENSIYQTGFVVSEINPQPGREYVKFSNGLRLQKGQEQGGSRQEIVKKQIQETIRAHFEKELDLRGKGIKVLSLFFIDRVDNYRKYTDTGYLKGIYAEWFEEQYLQLSEEYKKQGLPIVPAEDVHNGYFSRDKKGHFKDTEGKSRSDEDTYSLIMKDKEILLDPENPLKFIFSHSALREGWDNPNVFQICTLNETQSPMKKRQEIGRGIRLPVDKDGNRVFNTDINNLVVIANESYKDFVDGLQKNFIEDGVQFGSIPLDFFEGVLTIVDGQEKEISHEDSLELWTYLKDNNWIDEKGFITELFAEAVENQGFILPEKFRSITRETISRIEQHRIESHVTQYHVKKSKLHEEILLDPEFITFWNTISQKTIYSVNYTTNDLIQKTADAVKKMDRIEPLKLTTTKAGITVDQKGVKGDLISTTGS